MTEALDRGVTITILLEGSPAGAIDDQLRGGFLSGANLREANLTGAWLSGPTSGGPACARPN